jgi:hypothetical protein
MVVPLHCFVRGDTLGLVVLAHDRDTLEQLAAAILRAAAPRIAAPARAALYFGSQRLDPRLTVAQAGLAALDRVDVVPEDRHGA